MKPVYFQRGIEIALMVGAPLALAVLEIFHPHPHDLFHLDLRAWLLVHYLQIALFPLSALALVSLVHAHADFAASLCRAAMFVFAATYIAYDTAAGVVTGVLVMAARATGTPETWRASVMAIWKHPLIGGAPHTAPLLAVLGGMAWLVGATAAAVSVRRSGSSWMPWALLIVSALGLVVFRTHAWPGGPITFGALGAAAAWLQWEQRKKANTLCYAVLSGYEI
jgi:hypothetical protein